MTTYEPGTLAVATVRGVPNVRVFERVASSERECWQSDGYSPWDRHVIQHIRDELAGRDLACWCPLDQPCHADVLLEIANGGAA